MTVKLLYFAWVREKIGKAEEIVDLPVDLATVADLFAWLKKPGTRVRRGIRATRRRAGRHRQEARAAGLPHRRRARDRAVSAGHGRLTVAIRVQREDFDIGAEVARLQAGRTDIGAIVTFTGTVRGDNAGVTAMTLEHYPGMTEVELARVEAEAAARWPLQASLVVHRVGTLRPGDNIVLVVTASAHRQAAFAAAEFLMDYLKTRAPFWKKELGADGRERWVEARESDDAAAERWAGAEKNRS